MRNPPKTKEEYDKRHAIYVSYLKMKQDEEDWHGVSDAANDLRELEACLPLPPVSLLKPSSQDIWDHLKRHQPSVILSNDTPSLTPSPGSTTLPGL